MMVVSALREGVKGELQVELAQLRAVAEVR